MANAKQDLIDAAGVICSSAEETRSLGVRLGATLEIGSVVSLEGTLGAGKTQFAKGLAAGVGCRAEASSPSFALVHEYEGGRIPLFHFDFYRLKGPEELVTSGYDDCLAEGATIVEWGGRFPEVLPRDAIRLQFDVQSDGSRRISRTL